MAGQTLYLFDGYNLLHAGGFADVREVVDRLAGFVAQRGARGVVVFDGVGTDSEVGPLSVRYAEHADVLLEQLAVQRDVGEEVVLVTSDRVLRETAGRRVQARSCSSDHIG